MPDTAEKRRKTAGVVNSEWRAGVENERDTVTQELVAAEKEVVEAEKYCASLRAKLEFADRVLGLPFAQGGGNGDA